MVLGIVGLFFWILPFIGYPATIVGIVMSAIGLKSDKKGQAIAGLVMSVIGLIATVINSIIGALMLATIFST